ncbi:sugar 3,4-ketoisomerase [Paenibacillus polysaccharolyticus]|uniref:sugar 3,4-ketoisomerase n=1 Tax=Paenibacillus polysaccharolyticus TaxID=582692 RepID=UPI00280C2C97|nr:FdtA/QdtA family cupin domain-containing protein [Paenibacillus polysaccharolyticus]
MIQSKESMLLQIKELGDDRGLLAVVESHNSIPFDIKRVFYIYDTLPDVRRGFHAHYKTRQALICVKGACKILLDNINRKTVVSLDSPTKVLVLEPNDWHEMYDFTSDCVLLVLASHLYDSEDYIRDYDKFLEVYGE